ncbi:MAG: hypothetical protein KAS39_05815 [Actinomycetia bacterium]|nr:hypothetical protein [Actinomycetes bacterium]
METTKKPRTEKEEILELIDRDPLIYKEEVIRRVGCTRSYLNRVLKSERLAMLNAAELTPEIERKRNWAFLDDICIGCKKSNIALNRCSVYAIIPDMYIRANVCPFNNNTMFSTPMIQEKKKR